MLCFPLILASGLLPFGRKNLQNRRIHGIDIEKENASKEAYVI